MLHIVLDRLVGLDGQIQAGFGEGIWRYAVDVDRQDVFQGGCDVVERIFSLERQLADLAAGVVRNRAPSSACVAVAVPTTWLLWSSLTVDPTGTPPTRIFRLAAFVKLSVEDDPASDSGSKSTPRTDMFTNSVSMGEFSGVPPSTNVPTKTGNVPANPTGGVTETLLLVTVMVGVKEEPIRKQSLPDCLPHRWLLR